VGDQGLEPSGIVATPVVSERSLETNDKCLILGSDGLWDMVSNSKAVQYAEKHFPDAQQAAAALIRLATKRWRKAEVSYRDDISAIVVYLAGPSGSPPNRLVAAELAVHGAQGLGANDFDSSAPEDDGIVDKGEVDDDETADEDDSDDEEAQPTPRKDEKKGDAQFEARRLTVQAIRDEARKLMEERNSTPSAAEGAPGAGGVGDGAPAPGSCANAAEQVAAARAAAKAAKAAGGAAAVKYAPAAAGEVPVRSTSCCVVS